MAPAVAPLKPNILPFQEFFTMALTSRLVAMILFIRIGPAHARI